MNHADEAIERVLTGLQASEAAAGMEGRILQVVQARAADQLVQRKQGQTFGWLIPARNLLFAVLLLAITGLLLTYFVTHRGGPSKQAEVPTHPGAGKLTEALTDGTEPQAISKTRGRQATRLSAYKAKRRESLAIRELLAPSQVAPPLPMTAQEQLLSRVSQIGGSAELAMIHDQQDQLRQDAKSDADFRHFFGLNDTGGSR